MSTHQNATKGRSIIRWFFNSISSSLARFINGNHILLRLPWKQLCLPVELGGLGLIDPQAQQLAFQPRWLQQLLCPLTTHSSPLAFWMQAYITSLSPPLNSFFSLLLPTFRISDSLPFHSPFLLIAKLLSFISIDFIKISWSPAMCLDAPLWLLYQVPSTHWLHKKKYRLLRGCDVFALSSTSNSLIINPNISPDIPVGRYFINQLKSTLTSTPAFQFYRYISDTFSSTNDPAPPTPPSIALQTWNHIRKLRWSNTTIRSLHYHSCFPIHHGPPTIPPQQWKKFWKIRISPAARNAWYRLLLNKWPALTRLHYFMPQQFPSPFCAACPAKYQTTRHMTLECPIRHLIWQTSWTQLFPNITFCDDTIWYSLLFLRPSPHIPQITTTLWLQFLGTSLHAIWNAHWALVFDNRPLRPTTIVSSILKTLSTIQAPTSSAGH